MGTPTPAAAGAHKLFQSTVRPGADDTIRKNRAMYDSIMDTLLGLDALIAKKQLAPIQLHLTTIKAQTTKVQASLDALDASLAKVKAFAQAHKAVLSELGEVVKLNAELADERRKAATRIPALKAARDKAEQALKDFAGNKTELNAEWATLESSARKAHQEVLGDVKTLHGHRDKARAASKAKDSKALAGAKGKAEMMPNPHLSDWPKAMQRKLADFANRYEKQPKVDKTVLAQLARDKVELNGVLERIALNARLIESVKREVAAIK